MASNDGYAEVVRKTKQLKYGIFFGTFDDNHGASPLNIAGVVHPLPPQHAIPGWQRVTMVAYETPESGTASKGYLDAGYWDLSIYMRFEGVSCPGANVMLGRYHIGKKYDDDDDDRQFKKRGPFIFWDAGGNQAGDDSTTDEEDSEDTDGTNPATEDDNEDNEDETYWLQMLQAHHAQNAT